MKQNQLAIKLWNYFCWNYPDIKVVIHRVCEKVQMLYLEQHLLSKFYHLNTVYGHYAAMAMFWSDCDTQLREALVDYALKEWAPEGMKLSDEEKALLGI